MARPLKHEVLDLYKQLLYLGQAYPKGYNYFRKRLHAAFDRNRSVDDPKKIRKLIDHGYYVQKELEALYMLRKYRTLYQRYYTEDGKVTVPGIDKGSDP